MTDKTIQAQPIQEGMIAPVSKQPEDIDEKELRHGREQHKGFKVGMYLQTPPFFFTRDKWPVPLVDNYRGSSCFLIAGGPSFGGVDKSKLAEPGILTMAMNNSVKSFRPNLWTCVDDPANFLRSIWVDPTIQKIVPISHIDKTIFDSNVWQMTSTKVGDCPNVIYYKRNEMFQAAQYLWEDSINWGNHTNLGGGRSVMLAAFRILFLLGIRRIYLLGVDFKMDENHKYHFEQNRTDQSIKGNNATYQQLDERFVELRPYLEQAGLQVYNCNMDSHMTAFDKMPFEEAHKLARSILPADLAQERTEGMYDRKATERANHQRAARAARPPQPPHVGTNGHKKGKTCENCSRKYVDQVNAQVNAARTALHTAKERTAHMEQMLELNDPNFNIDQLGELKKDEDNKRRAYRQLLKVRDQMTGTANAV